jgi:hypothetical protein
LGMLSVTRSGEPRLSVSWRATFSITNSESSQRSRTRRQRQP